MRKNLPESKKFIEACRSEAYRILTAWCNDIMCRYETDPYGKRDYVLRANHSWGTAYCNWKDDKERLFEALRNVGATNIIGRVEWNRVDIAFDIKKSRLKADGLA